jgi:4-azaleucine resistance transporter AzlC
MSKSAFREVWYAVLPLFVSYLPLGLASGILLQSVNFNVVQTLLISVLVFSGGAQFLVVSLLAASSSFGTILAMVFFLELRYALLGASLSRYFKQASTPFLAIFSQSMNDENYAVNHLKFITDELWDGRKALYVNWLSMLSWVLGNVIGTLGGAHLKMDSSLVHFALTSMFVYMLIMQVKNKKRLVAAVVSAILSVVLMMLIKNTFGIVLATIVASYAGHSFEQWQHKRRDARQAGEIQ